MLKLCITESKEPIHLGCDIDELVFSNSLIIHEAKTKENHKAWKHDQTLA